MSLFNDNQLDFDSEFNITFGWIASTPTFFVIGFIVIVFTILHRSYRIKNYKPILGTPSQDDGQDFYNKLNANSILNTSIIKAMESQNLETESSFVRQAHLSHSKTMGDAQSTVAIKDYQPSLNSDNVVPPHSPTQETPMIKVSAPKYKPRNWSTVTPSVPDNRNPEVVVSTPPPPPPTILPVQVGPLQQQSSTIPATRDSKSSVNLEGVVPNKIRSKKLAFICLQPTDSLGLLTVSKESKISTLSTEKAPNYGLQVTKTSSVQIAPKKIKIVAPKFLPISE